MIFDKNKKNIKPYLGNYKPLNIYHGRKKVAGYTNKVAVGQSVTIDNTYNEAFKGKVYGNSEQETSTHVPHKPSIDYPSEIKSLGDYNDETGKYDLKIESIGQNKLMKDGLSTSRTDVAFWNELSNNCTPVTNGWNKYAENTIQFPIAEPLRALECTSSDDWNIQKDGKYYIADYLDFKKKKVIRRNVKINAKDIANWTKGVLSNDTYSVFQTVNTSLPANYIQQIKTICNKFVYLNNLSIPILNVESVFINPTRWQND